MTIYGDHLHQELIKAAEQERAVRLERALLLGQDAPPRLSLWTRLRNRLSGRPNLAYRMPRSERIVSGA